MTDWVKRALTKTIQRKGSRGKTEVIIVQPNDKLVLGVKFAIAMTICLSALEVAHMFFLGRWNSEIFATITGVSGTVMGILIGQKA